MTATSSGTTSDTTPPYRRRTVSEVVADLESRIAKIKSRKRLYAFDQWEQNDTIMYGALVAYEEALRMIRMCRYRGNK